MATLTKKERAWLNELQDVLDRCPSPKKIGFYTIGDKSIYLCSCRSAATAGCHRHRRSLPEAPQKPLSVLPTGLMTPPAV